MEIGIIGTGISGLSAAFLLGDSGHEITLFEKQHEIGMSGHGISLGATSPFGEFKIDVPSRLLNALHWPSLLSLYHKAGIETEFVAACQSYVRGNEAVYLQFDPEDLFAFNPLAILASRLPKLFLELKQLRHAAESDLANGIAEQLSIEQYLVDGGYSMELKQGFLYPLLSSTVCTCSFEAIARYPATFILGILSNLNQAGGRPDSRLQRTRFGTSGVVDKLLVHKPEICLGVDVKRVASGGCGVSVEYGDDCNASREFDHVIIATQANHACQMMADDAIEVADALQRFVYEDVEIVLHNDERILPRKSHAWSTFNFSIDDDPGRANNSMCNIWLNRFYGVAENGEDWFQAINPIVEIDPDRILRRVRVQRPVVAPESFVGWNKLDEIHDQPDRRIWFAGSYASAGVPLLESGVVSVQNVVGRIESSLVKN